MVRFTVRRWATAAVVAGALAGLDAGVSSISGVGLLVGKAEAVVGRPAYAGKCRRRCASDRNARAWCARCWSSARGWRSWRGCHSRRWRAGKSRRPGQPCWPTLTHRVAGFRNADITRATPVPRDFGG